MSGFGGGDEAFAGGGSGFGEERQWGRAAFDGAGFAAIGAVGHAVRVAVPESEFDQAFSGAGVDRAGVGRAVCGNGGQGPRVGQHLQG